MVETKTPVVKRHPAVEKDMKEVTVITPCYNEEMTIERCISAIAHILETHFVTWEIIVVDDGSKDNTYKLALKVSSKRNNIMVLRHHKNLGKGRAVDTALKQASGCVILVQDADLEYSPDEIPRLADPILRGKADAVLGSRFLGSIDRMSVSHLVGNIFLTKLFNVVRRTKFTDIMTGHKAVEGSLFRAYSTKTNSFDFEIDLLCYLVSVYARIIELPIRYRRRLYGKAKIKWADGIKCAIWILRRLRFAPDE